MQSLNFSEMIIKKARKQGKNTILIIGEEPTKKKFDKAKELKISIIDQTQFLKMLNITS